MSEGIGASLRSKRPILLVTMGDPSGIGPEIVVKAVSKPSINIICKPVIVGDLKILQGICEQLGIELSFKRIRSPKRSGGGRGDLEVIDLGNVDAGSVEAGKISAEAGRASLEYVVRGVEHALKGDADALVTAPINKKAISLSGSQYIGHTELLAALTGVKEALTMFWVKGARIFFLTRHLPLRDALRSVKKDEILESILRIDDALEGIGVTDPCIAVAALNPHASDGGLLGTEEAEEISPAIDEARERGVNAWGPIPADTVFHQAVEGDYDAVLSMYHDQGHIAAKTLDFHGTISLTLGLPFIRTSVDHGTAHDIAGKGLANPQSLEDAISLAAELVKRRKPESHKAS